jgi:hypothetical protein
MDRRYVAALGLLSAVPLGGCDPRELFTMSPLAIEMRIAEGGFYNYAKATPFEATLDVEIGAVVGGVDGTYTVTLDDPEGGTFGTFTGTGVVKRGRFVTIKAKDTPELLATVEALVEAAHGQDITLTKAKATVKANQSIGGVDPTFKAKITFAGTMTGSGDKIKAGKIFAGHTFDQDL